MSDNSTPTAKVLLTRAEAAAEIGCSEYEMGKLVDAGAVRALRVGKNVRVHRASLEAFKAGKLDEAASA